MEEKKVLAKELIDLCEYLALLGYRIQPGFVGEFFDFYAKTNLENWELRDMAPVLGPMIVKSKKEDKTFLEDFKAFFAGTPPKISSKRLRKQQQKYERQISSVKQEKDDLEKEQEKYQKKLERLKSTKDEALLTSRKIKNIDKRRDALGEEWKEIALEENKLLDVFHEQVAKQESFLQRELDELDEMLQNLMKKAVFCENYAGIMKHIAQERKLIKDLEKRQSRNREEEIKQYEFKANATEVLLQRKSAQYEKLQREWKKESERIIREEWEKIIEKEAAKKHREEFTVGKNAVRSSAESIHKALDKPFNQLTNKEKEEIRSYIRENTQKFRTKMVRNMRCRHDKKIDMEDTCKKSCATDGIPMRLSFKRERPQRAKLFLLLDVSGSCKHASEMMLLFIYFMKEAFPGGCSAYAFTNKIYDLSSFFDAPSGDQMAKAVLDAIPRSGAYSDYNRPFYELFSEHMAEIDKNTLLFVIGDARNNKNPSGEAYFKSMARKAKKVLWMNTDDLEKWDEGDSIISTYAPYVHALKEVKTPAQLINFLVEMRT